MIPAIRPRGDALTVPVAGEPSVSANQQIASTHRSSSFTSSPARHGTSSSPSMNKAIIAVSVIMAIAMIAVLIWYWRERRSERSQVRDRRIRLAQSPGSVLPLKTSFHPSLKSSFGFTGASPDSPWSRTDTITPLSRAAGQETLYSPLSGGGMIPSPQQGQCPHHSTLPQPPFTANTQRTFRTSIHSVIVNRDSATIGHASLANDFFPPSPTANGRPRLTRLPSYHTDYAKTSPFIPDQKKGFIPAPDIGTNTTSASEYTSSLGRGIPPLPQRAPSEVTLPTPTTTTYIHPPRTPKTLPRILTRTRESALEYLNNVDTPSSTASLRAMVNTSAPSSARPSRGDSLSEDLRGLLFLGSSVTVDERPLRPDAPAAPDLSPTRGWSRLPDPENGRRLV